MACLTHEGVKKVGATGINRAATGMFHIRMATAQDRTLSDKTAELVATNIAWLRQALSLLGRLDDRAFGSSPKPLDPHRVGSHLRHVLEFYECFLDGVGSSHIDYDARKRDELVEKSRHAAGEKVCEIIRRLQENPNLEADALVSVRMENADAYLRSSIARELQALSSHTIHHFALISVTLRLHGFQVDPDFGMSPSTLRYQASRARTVAPEAA